MRSLPGRGMIGVPIDDEDWICRKRSGSRRLVKMIVETKYARRGNASVAYQTIGQGEIDLVFVPCWISHLERLWKEPRFARFIERLAAFGRVILFDKRGTGLSDPAPATTFPSLEERMEDLAAVLDAVGSRRAILVGS